MPSPVQARAYATVRAAIDATAALIEERGEDSVRFSDVIERSGISAGSLTHHFGSREGLIAAALMEMYDRVAHRRSQSFGLDATDAASFATGLRRIVVSTAGGERDAWRLARIRTLAYARRRPELREAIVTSVASLDVGMAAQVASATSEDASSPTSAPDGIPPRAIVVFSELYSAGRIVDTVFADPLPTEQWTALFARLTRVFVDDDVAEAALGAPSRPGPDASAAVTDLRPELPQLELEEDERRTLAAAVELQRTGGMSAVLVQDLAALTGLSRSWMARHFGEREHIIDLVHLQNLLSFAEQECRLLEAAFDDAVGSEDLARRLDDVVASMSQQSSLGAAWDRLELVASAASRSQLVTLAAPVVLAVLARISSAISAAQARGLVRPDVPARALARFLWAAPLGFVLGEVVGVEWHELHELGRRTSRTWIVPGVTQHRAESPRA